MSNAAIDSNSRQTMTARLNSDGITVIRIQATPAGLLAINDGSSGTVVTNEFAATDDNGRPTMFAVSSAGDGTLIALQADSSGKLLIKSS